MASSDKMVAGNLYSCVWRTNQWNHQTGNWDRGWDMLLFLGIETIHRDDGVEIRNYRFHDIVTNDNVLMDEYLVQHCEEIKGGSNERN